MQRDQCHSAFHLSNWKGGDFESLHGWADPENLEGTGPDLGKG